MVSKAREQGKAPKSGPKEEADKEKIPKYHFSTI
jgi:hypothetical protein